MSNFYFRKGFEFNLHNQPCVMHSNLDDGWQIEDRKSGRITFHKTSVLMEDFMQGHLIPNIPVPSILKKIDKDVWIQQVISDLPPIEQHKVKMKQAFVSYFRKRYDGFCTLKNVGLALKEYWIVQEMGTKPSKETAYTWLLKSKRSGNDPAALISRVSMRGPRKRKLLQETLDLCLGVVHQFYMHKNRITVDRTHEKIRVAVARENKLLPPSQQHKLPSISTIHRLIGEIPKYNVCKARYGKEYADLKFHTVTDQTPRSHLNSRWEIDHTPMDVIALDDEYGNVIGRPILTTIVEVGSQCIMAAYLSFEETTAVRVLNTLRQAILTKDEILKEFPSIENDWPCYGLPDLLFSDRGKELIGMLVEAFCLAMSIDTGIARAQHGDDKGSIERIAGMLNDMVCQELPGKTFSSLAEKTHGYNPQKFAVVPLKALRESVYRNVCDIYHKNHHSSLGMQPIEMWMQEVQDRDLRLPSSIDCLDANICMPDRRKLGKRGVEINSLAYSSKELERLIDTIGHRNVDIKWNPEDMGYILVCLDGGGFLRVPLNKTYFHYGNGLSKKVHDVIRQGRPKGNSPEHSLYLAQKKDSILSDVVTKSNTLKRSLNKRDMEIRNNITKSIESSQKIQSHSMNNHHASNLDEFYNDKIPDLGTL